MTTCNIKRGTTPDKLTNYTSIILGNDVKTASDLRRVLKKGSLMPDSDQFLSKAGFPLSSSSETTVLWTDLVVDDVGVPFFIYDDYLDIL
jgi:hypothetical protein